MNCNKCGKPNDLDSKFCVHCGNSLVDEMNYSQGNLEPFEKSGTWGYKDKDTLDVIIPPKYTGAGNFYDNRAIVSINRKYAIIDQNGKELTPFKYDFISDFEKSFARIKRDDKWTFISTDCNLVSPFKYSSISKLDEGCLKAKIENKYVLVDYQGKKLTQIAYDNISPFVNDFAKVENNSKNGLIDKEGKEILTCEYDSISTFRKGLIILKKSNKYGIINSLGNTILDCHYDEVEILKNGSIKVRLKKEWYCFNNEGLDITSSNSNFIQKKKYGKTTIIGMFFLVLALSSLVIYFYNVKEKEPYEIGRLPGDILSKGFIKGVNIILRENYSTTSRILSSFKYSGEEVEILDEFITENKLEAILNENIQVVSNNETIVLLKGKAVFIKSENNGALVVTFEDKDLKTHRVNIESKYLNKLKNVKWYKIKRNNGEIGWVYGEFVEFVRPKFNKDFYRVVGVCPYEGCSYGEWLTKEIVNIYKEPRSNNKVGEMPQNVKFIALNGEINLIPGIAYKVKKTPFSYLNIEYDIPIYILHYVGEGTTKTFHNGKFQNIELPRSENDKKYYEWLRIDKFPKKIEWWVKIKYKNITGWILVDGNVNSIDTLG